MRANGRIQRLGAEALTVGLLVTSVVAGIGGASADEGAADPAGGAVVEISTDATTLHVDGSHSSVAPDGTAAQPFRTITAGVAAAQQLRTSGRQVRILVAPGVYRETVSIGSTGQSNPPALSIEGPGAVVTGADIETRWSAVSGTRFVSAPWAQKWGMTPVPASWGSISVPDMVRRREGVLVDGQPLVQVASQSKLFPGSFTVEESKSRIVVDPPAGSSGLTGRRVEVARRDRALQIQGQARSVLVSGFTFEAAAAPFTGYMAYVSDAVDILLEGNTFRYSSGGGLGFCCVTRATARNNVASDNGINGLDTYKATDIVVAGNTVTGNNRRGHQNGFVGWATAGSKNLLLHDAVFRGNTYERNFARGLWFDTDVANVVVDGDRSCDNRGDGVFIEAVQGPLTVRDTTFCDNDRAGILVGTSGNVTVTGSSMTGNDYGQLVFAGVRQRSWTDSRTGAKVTMGDFADWQLLGNTFASSGTAPLIYSPVVPIDDWRAHLAAGEITASGNSWARPAAANAIKIQATDFSMPEWNASTGDSAALELSEPAGGSDTTASGQSTEPGTAPSPEPSPNPLTTLLKSLGLG